MLTQHHTQKAHTGVHSHAAHHVNFLGVALLGSGALLAGALALYGQQIAASGLSQFLGW